jgi:nicotinate-nucleotide adenylyltransferase
MSFIESRAKDEKKVYAWLGGSFDPVHYGHLIAAQELVDQLKLEHLSLTPCYLSPLKQQTACSAQDRINMLRLAIENCPYFVLDLREIERGGDSRSVETAREIREEKGENACLLCAIGWDVFLGLHTWYAWEKLFDYCNVVVVNRPGFVQAIPEVLQQWCNGREVVKEELPYFNFGKITFLNTPLVEISSSAIRQKCKRALSLRFMLPEKVEQYIVDKELFLKNTE